MENLMIQGNGENEIPSEGIDKETGVNINEN